jgi:hypothetical protein
MTFELNITDINDQTPYFLHNYTFDIIENNLIPITIGQIIANDTDEDLNSRVTYTIVPSSVDFFISSTTGVLTSNVSFDYEYQRLYSLQVRARDHGRPALESFVNVKINVINVNEYSPIFEHELYRFFINENSTDKQRQYLGQVKAHDRDYGDQIRYVLINDNDRFQIDQHGQIWTECIFDREQHEQYRLNIIATDNRTTGSTTVIIHVK